MEIFMLNIFFTQFLFKFCAYLNKNYICIVFIIAFKKVLNVDSIYLFILIEMYIYK